VCYLSYGFAELDWEGRRALEVLLVLAAFLASNGLTHEAGKGRKGHVVRVSTSS
jgi:hypothetical protein